MTYDAPLTPTRMSMRPSTQKNTKEARERTPLGSLQLRNKRGCRGLERRAGEGGDEDDDSLKSVANLSSLYAEGKENIRADGDESLLLLESDASESGDDDSESGDIAVPEVQVQVADASTQTEPTRSRARKNHQSNTNGVVVKMEDDDEGVVSVDAATQAGTSHKTEDMDNEEPPFERIPTTQNEEEEEEEEEIADALTQCGDVEGDALSQGSDRNHNEEENENSSGVEEKSLIDQVEVKIEDSRDEEPAAADLHHRVNKEDTGNLASASPVRNDQVGFSHSHTPASPAA